MRDSKITWEQSRLLYAELNAELEELLADTQLLWERYKDRNIAFAYEIYGDPMLHILRKADGLDIYETAFAEVHHAFEKSVRILEEVKAKVGMMMLTDRVNHPPN